MSNNGANGPKTEGSPSRSGAGSGIRLPPISFLSRSLDSNNALLLSLVLPIAPSFGSLLPPMLKDGGVPALHRPLGTGLFGADPEPSHDENNKVTFPKPLLEEYSSTGTGSPHVLKQEIQSNSPTFSQDPAPQNVPQPQMEQSQPLPHTHRHHLLSETGHHHHHHVHRHNHHHHHHHRPLEDFVNGNGKQLAEIPKRVKRAKGPPVVLDKTTLRDLLDDLYPHRHHLGTILYSPTTTWATLQIEQLHGLREHDRQRLLDIRSGWEARLEERYTSEKLAYIPMLPPLTEAYINCFVEVKIPYKHIKQFLEQMSEGKVQRTRELWGGAGGLYTDDSNLLSVLCHLGLFSGNFNLTDCNDTWTKADVVRPLVVKRDSDGVELLDLSVTLLMLPTIKQYHGFFRNGINSRSWIGDSVHDGLSFGVFSVKWETYVSSLSERNLRKIAQRENMDDREAEEDLLTARKGWKFDYKCYKELKEKFSTMETSKNPRDTVQ